MPAYALCSNHPNDKAYGNWADGVGEKKRAASARVQQRLSPKKNFDGSATNPESEPAYLMNGGQPAPRYGVKHKGKDQADHFEDHAGFVIDTGLEGTQTDDRPDMMLVDGTTAAVPKYGAGHEHKDTEDNFNSGLVPEVGHDIFADQTAKYGSGHEHKDTESQFKKAAFLSLEASTNPTSEEHREPRLTSPNDQPLTNLEIGMVPIFGAAKGDSNFANRKFKEVKLQAMGGGVAVPQTREQRLAQKKALKSKTLAITKLKPPKPAKKLGGMIDYRKAKSKKDAMNAAAHLLVQNASADTSKTLLQSATNSRSSSKTTSANSAKTVQSRKSTTGQQQHSRKKESAVVLDFETSYGKEGLDSYENMNHGLAMQVKGSANEETFETSYGTEGLDSKDNVGSGLDLVPHPDSKEELGRGRLPGFGRDMLDSLENLRVDMIPNNGADAADKKWESGPGERGIKDATSLTSSLVPAPESKKVVAKVVVSKPKKATMKYGGRVVYTTVADTILSRFSAKTARLAFPGYHSGVLAVKE